MLAGPEPVSLLGLRLPNESSGSSSLFAHPAAPQPTELGGTQRAEAPDARLDAALAKLYAMIKSANRDELGDSQALLARWWFRPQLKREGELVFAEETPIDRKALLRACARTYRAHVERTAPVLA